MNQHMIVIHPTELSTFLFGGDPLPRLMVQTGAEEWMSAPEGGVSCLVLTFTIHASDECASGRAIIAATAAGWLLGFDIRQLNVYPRTTSSRPCPVSLEPALERSIREHVAWRVVAEQGMPSEQSTARHRRIWFLWDGQEYRADAAGWQDVPESEVTGEQ